MHVVCCLFFSFNHFFKHVDIDIYIYKIRHILKHTGTPMHENGLENTHTKYDYIGFRKVCQMLNKKEIELLFTIICQEEGRRKVNDCQNKLK